MSGPKYTTPAPEFRMPDLDAVLAEPTPEEFAREELLSLRSQVKGWADRCAEYHTNAVRLGKTLRDLVAKHADTTGKLEKRLRQSERARAKLLAQRNDMLAHLLAVVRQRDALQARLDERSEP